MMFEILAEGFVSERQANTPTAVAAMPRCVPGADGDLICTYVVQSALTVNDFVPMVSRSKDLGRTWEERGPIWPQLKNSYSIVCSVSRAPSGELILFGSQSPIDHPGETCWSDATQGIKQNELIWSKSIDGGRSWLDPRVISMPTVGSAEVPGPMCVTRGGRWLGPYAPYHTFDSHLVVDRNQVVVVISSDQGKTWAHTSMLRFDDAQSGGAEAWVIELADGRLLGASWHLNHQDGSDYPNAYGISLDGGMTWQPTRSTGILGQSTALTALPDGRALFVYNQRKHGDIGVWLALVNPTESDFGIEANEILWRAETATQEGSSADHFSWKDFAFGEPSVALLPDGTLLMVFWSIQPSGRGIRYIRFNVRGMSL